MTITPENPASQEMNTAKAIDTLLDDLSEQLRELSDRIANLESNEGPPATVQAITTLYDNTLSVNGSWDVQNSDLITGVGNFADYDYLEIFLFDLRSTLAANADVIYLLYGTGGGALDTTNTNYSRQQVGGTGVTVATNRADLPQILNTDGASSDADMYGFHRIEIYAPGGNKHKQAICAAGVRNVAATAEVRLFEHNWENTGTITRIGIRTDNNPTDLITSGGRMVILGHTF